MNKSKSISRIFEQLTCAIYRTKRVTDVKFCNCSLRWEKFDNKLNPIPVSPDYKENFDQFYIRLRTC